MHCMYKLGIISNCIQVTVSGQDAGPPIACVRCTIASSVAQPPVTTTFFIQGSRFLLLQLQLHLVGDSYSSYSSITHVWAPKLRERVDNKAKQAALGDRHPGTAVHQSRNEDMSRHAPHHGYQGVLPAAPQTKGSHRQDVSKGSTRCKT